MDCVHKQSKIQVLTTEFLMTAQGKSDKRTWRIVEFKVDASQEDMASWLMIQLGANGCEVDSEPDSDALRLRATFDEDKLPGGDTTKISAAMEEYGLSKNLSSLRVSELVEEDWLAKWKLGFAPFTVGQRLLVCPEWERNNLDPVLKGDRRVIYIEPGLAFGTGFHPTTRFCLATVEQCIPNAKRVVDVGTGSGILAIGAALLKDDVEIVALETDPLACKVALENFEFNGVTGRIQLHEGSTEQLLKSEPAKPFDLVLSNLTYEDNAALLPDYLKLTAPGTMFGFAGILREKLDRMKAALAQHGLEVVDEEVGDMWAGLLVRRP
jgi:ribosomal protein L11 methyltransferase